jgi:hypothetical protein
MFTEITTSRQPSNLYVSLNVAQFTKLEILLCRFVVYVEIRAYASKFFQINVNNNTKRASLFDEYLEVFLKTYETNMVPYYNKLFAEKKYDRFCLSHRKVRHERFSHSYIFN